MALEPIYGKGISLASGFDLGAKSPLDSRSIVNTIEERDAHVAGNRAYPGMKVYVLEEQKEYRYTGSGWKELDVVDLSTVHKHENKDVLDGITAVDISNWNAKSDFSGSYLDLSDLPEIPSKVSDLNNDLTDKPTIPTNVSQLTNDLSLATENFVLNKIAEAELNQKEVDLSGYATKDDLTNYVTLNVMGSTLTDYVTFTDLENEGFTTQTYVDNQIATHEHNTMSIDDANTMFNNLYTK